jgi:shikimate kinase
MNILLLGLRGSGKTTVGRLLAAHLDWPLFDVDDAALGILGCGSVTEAWRQQGEAGFRRAEVQALAQALEQPGQVVALGGGTPIAPGAAELLQKAQAAGQAVLIYLAADPATLRERLGAAGAIDRPPLLGDDPLTEIDAVFEVRDPFYRQLADHIVDAGGSPEAVAEAVLRRLTARA